MAKNETPELGSGKNIEFTAKIIRKNVVFEVDEIYATKNVNVYIDNDFVISVNVGGKGLLKLSRKNKLGKLITEAVNDGNRVKLTV